MAPVVNEAAVGEGRRRTRTPLIVREDVVEAALALLDEGGYAHLSMRNLCRRLGVSLPTVYAAARSKESVVESAGGRGLDRWVRAFTDGADGAGSLVDVGPGGALEAAAAAMARRPWLFELVRLEPELARATLDQLTDEALATVATLGPSELRPSEHRSLELRPPDTASAATDGTGAPPTATETESLESGARSVRLDGALLVWMTLELAHRLVATGVARDDGARLTAPLAASLLAAVVPWAPGG